MTTKNKKILTICASPFLTILAIKSVVTLSLYAFNVKTFDELDYFLAVSSVLISAISPVFSVFIIEEYFGGL